MLIYIIIKVLRIINILPVHIIIFSLLKYFAVKAHFRKHSSERNGGSMITKSNSLFHLFGMCGGNGLL